MNFPDLEGKSDLLDLSLLLRSLFWFDFFLHLRLFLLPL